MVMVGEHNGLQALAKKKYKNLIHIKCVPHTCDLCGKEAMKMMPDCVEWMITGLASNTIYFCLLVKDNIQ